MANGANDGLLKWLLNCAKSSHFVWDIIIKYSSFNPSFNKAILYKCLIILSDSYCHRSKWGIFDIIFSFWQNMTWCKKIITKRTAIPWCDLVPSTELKITEKLSIQKVRKYVQHSGKTAAQNKYACTVHQINRILKSQDQCRSLNEPYQILRKEHASISMDPTPENEWENKKRWNEHIHKHKNNIYC